MCRHGLSPELRLKRAIQITYSSIGGQSMGVGMVVAASCGSVSCFRGRRAAKRCTKFGILFRVKSRCRIYSISWELMGSCFVGRNITKSSSFWSRFNFPIRSTKAWINSCNKIWRNGAMASSCRVHTVQIPWRSDLSSFRSANPPVWVWVVQSSVANRPAVHSR